MRKIKDRPVVFFKDGYRLIDISEDLKRSTLFKACSRTSKWNCQFFFELLWAKLTNQITEEDFNKEILKMNLAFEEIENEDLTVSSRFEPKTQLTFIKVSAGLERLIKENIKSKFDAVEYSQLEKLSDFCWHNFIQGDTKVDSLKLFNGCVTYRFSASLKTLQNFIFEAEAFGEKLGSILITKYELKANSEFSLRSKIDSIFQDLKNEKVDDDFVKDVWRIYKDPRIPEEAQTSFVRTLYDYLESSGEVVLEEKTISEKLRFEKLLECFKFNPNVTRTEKM